MKNPKDMTQGIRGTVDEVLFYNAENGYVVADLETEDALITIVGELGEIEPGEELELTGRFVSHPRYGDQFRADSCVRALPSTVVNIERYLGSGVIRGIGKALARRIVAEFGEFTFQVIENEPDKLCRIKGITPQKCEEISEAAQQIFGLRNLMDRLQAFGISASVAMKAYRKWEHAAWEMIRENPYRLCRLGVEFRLVEKMAYQMEIPQDSPKRMIAGFQWILEQYALEGHACMMFGAFQNQTVNELNVDVQVFQKAYQEALEERVLMAYSAAEGDFVYLEEYYIAERFIADRIAAMLAFSSPHDFDCTKAIAEDEQETGMVYAEQQKKAIACAFSRGIMILTGGPGTGKTTTLNSVIHLCKKAGSKILLAAPTGRAAKRMTELTGREAKTIHRMLGTVAGEEGLVFQHHEQNPLEADVIIVDEVSMVDVLLFECLLRAVRLSARVILVGDEDQLPSVGAGYLLHSLIASKRIPVVRLTEIFRQAQESGIVQNAHKIVNGIVPDLTEKHKDFFFFDRRDAREAMELLRDLYVKRLPQAFQYTPQTDIQVISPTKKGILGVVTLNQMLQEAVNPPQYGKMVLKNLLYTFREGDKVMQTMNQYDMEWTKDGIRGTGVFNGDIGTVKWVDKNTNQLLVDYEGRIVKYTKEQVDQLELSYAVTVHKSQGSEFEAVILMLGEGTDRLSYRSLLYTAVTRAKHLLIIIGAPRKMAEMIYNQQRALRYSCLTDMLENTASREEEEI
ncbi:MAG: ATP-dependent RecD-like DNA helicase [Oscillospiraceae bacterium]|nr:ATP-dependent RecD-like DNA helicase [Oscillospiraceae bacterium]